MPGIREAARAVQAYTERHMARLNRLLQASFLLDFTLDRAHILSPLEASPCLCGFPTFATFNHFACLGLALEALPLWPAKICQASLCLFYSAASSGLGSTAVSSDPGPLMTCAGP